MRERNTLTLETAIAKLSGVSAARLGLRDQGVLREGAFADLVVLDPGTVADVATYERPSSRDRDRACGRERAPGRAGGPGDRRTSGPAAATSRMRRTTARRTRAVPGTEGPAVAQLSGGPLPYTLRQSPRARGLRVVIHPDRGVVVTVPATRIGRTDGERRAVEFLEEREPWIRRHLARHADVRAELAARGGARDGGSIRLEGRVVPIRVVPAVVGSRRSTVARFDELVIHRAERDRRPDAAVIEAWLRDLARERIDEAVADHARALGVRPRTSRSATRAAAEVPRRKAASHCRGDWCSPRAKASRRS